MAELTPAFLDADPGTGNPKVSSGDLRAAFHGVQAGVQDAGDLLVTAGPGLWVDVAAGRALVFSSLGAYRQGRKYAIANDAVKGSYDFEGGGIPANASANPRLDAVVAQVWDDTQDASGQRKWRLVYVQGTAAPGVALGSGLPTLPTPSLLLAEVLVPGGNPTTIPSANVRDRRSWARGFGYAVDGITSGPTTASSTHALLPEMTITGEFTGTPVDVSFSGMFSHSVANNYVDTRIQVDGANPPGISDPIRGANAPGASQNISLGYVLRFVPTAGRHTITVTWATQAATATSFGTRRRLSVREIVQQNSAQAS